MTPLCPGAVGQGMSVMGSQEHPVSQVPVVFHCSLLTLLARELSSWQAGSKVLLSGIAAAAASEEAALAFSGSSPLLN